MPSPAVVRSEVRRGPVALVTGGSRGIGRAISEELARAGYSVAINYRGDHTAALSLAERLVAAGLEAHAFRANVAEPDEVRRLLGAVEERLGAPPSVVINNVGEFSLGTVANTRPERWRDIIESNLNSAYYVSHEALPAMRRRGAGHVIFIGMAPALLVRGAANIAGYAVAKTGIAVLTRSLAVEETPNGISVNCVAPGLIDTGELPPEQAEWMRLRVPSGRLGRPEEVAGVVSFLLSSTASYVSGATLSVGGGWEWDDRSVAHDEVVGEVFHAANG